MKELLDQIKAKAELLWAYGPNADSLELDTMLGQLDLLIHDARLLIDEDWRALREQAFAHKPTSTTLQDLI